MYVFKKRGLSLTGLCEGGFSLRFPCSLINMINSSENNYYPQLKGTGHVLPECKGIIPYSANSNFPFWANVYLRESIEDFGIKTKILSD